MRGVGVERAALPKIAEISMRNAWVRSNPRRIEQVMEILEAAW